MNLLDNKPHRPSKFRTKYWVDTDDDSRGTYNTNSQIKFKTSMLNPCDYLCEYSDAYILVKRTITVPYTAVPPVSANNINKKVIFRNCASFTECISEIDNTQVDNAKDIDVVIPMYNFIEYRDNYLKKPGT